MPQLIVYPHPQHSCLDQIQSIYALANGCSCATQWARLYCLETLNQKTGSYQLASGGKEADPWSHCLIVAETKLFTDIRPCVVLVLMELLITWQHLPFLEPVLSGNQNHHPINTILVFLSWYWYFRIRNLCVYVCAQSCLTLCNPMNCTLPGSSVHGISQERILVVISSSRGFSRPRNWTCVSCISYIGRRILYHCTPWEAQEPPSVHVY